MIGVEFDIKLTEAKFSSLQSFDLFCVENKLILSDARSIGVNEWHVKIIGEVENINALLKRIKKGKDKTAREQKVINFFISLFNFNNTLLHK